MRILSLCLVIFAGTALAQPEPANPAMNPAPPGGNPGMPGMVQPPPTGIPHMMMPPGLNTAFMVRNLLTQAGFNDKDLQDAVVNEAQTQQKAATALQEKTRVLAEAIRMNALDDAKITHLMDSFSAAVQDERKARLDRAKELDQKIGYSQKPRLRALLSLTGIVGDEVSLLAPPATVPVPGLVGGGYGARWFGPMTNAPGFGGGGFGGGAGGGFGGGAGVGAGPIPPGTPQGFGGVLMAPQPAPQPNQPAPAAVQQRQ